MFSEIVHYVRRNLIGFSALFLALGGTSYAAVTFPANSVGTRQLKAHAVTLPKLSRQAVASLRGQRGPAGPAGTSGPAGPVNVTYVSSGANDVSAGTTAGTDAKCPSGTVPSGGGVTTQDGDNEYVAASSFDTTSGATSPNAWVGYVHNNSTTSTLQYTVFAVCVHASSTTGP